MDKIISDMSKGLEVFFCRPKEEGEEILTQQQIDDAWQRVRRFSDYVKAAFPETEKTQGIIDSPLQMINETKKELELREGVVIQGDLHVKRDDSLELSRLLYRSSGIKAEPSSCVALAGVGRMACSVENLQNATHLVWLTGGSLVPEQEWEKTGIYK